LPDQSTRVSVLTGFCAEAAAIADMLKHRETQILLVVAVSGDGTLLAPCGRCRDMMAQVNSENLDAQVLHEGGRAVPLRALLPETRIEDKEQRTPNQ